jgi:hypothetical protein
MKYTFDNFTIDSKNFVDTILNASSQDCIVYWTPTETHITASIFDHCSEETLANHITHNNLDVRIVLGSPIEISTLNPWPKFFQACRLEYWEMLYPCHALLPWENVKLLDPNNLSKLYVTMNRLPHQHRATIVDNLAKHNMLDTGYYTWVLPHFPGAKLEVTNSNAKFQYWTEERKTFASEPDARDKVELHDIPTEYHECLIDIIGETNPDHYFYTEKTFKALLTARPFLLIGAKGINKFLQSRYGFELYHEIFDYSFDDLDSAEDRTEQAILQVKKYQDSDLKEVYLKVKEKAIRNTKHLYEWSINNKCGATSVSVQTRQQYADLYSSPDDPVDVALMSCKEYWQSIGFIERNIWKI